MWYRLNYSTEETVIGKYPQTDKYMEGAQTFLLDVKAISPDKHLEINYNINYILLKNAAKFTDIICCSQSKGRGLIISEKLHDIIDNYKIYNVKFYNTLLKQKNTSRNYFFMRLAGSFINYIDYSKTLFRTYKSGEVVKEFKCISASDYEFKRQEQTKLDSINPVCIHELYLSDEFLSQGFDCIYLGRLDSVSIIINEKLKKALESENLTIDIKPYGLIKN